MKVKELLQELERKDPNARVYVMHEGRDLKPMGIRKAKVRDTSFYGLPHDSVIIDVK